MYSNRTNWFAYNPDTLNIADVYHSTFIRKILHSIKSETHVVLIYSLSAR